MMTKVYQGPIKLVLFDVDGVLTDGALYIGGTGESVKAFNVKDGLAVTLLRCHRIASGVLSGKSSASLDYRVKQLNFDVSITGCLEKKRTYLALIKELGLRNEEVAFVGDDVVDLPLAGLVGIFFAPVDAHELVQKRADHVLKSPGGKGVAREVVEHILQSDGMTLEQAYEPLIGQWSRHGAAQ